MRNVLSVVALVGVAAVLVGCSGCGCEPDPCCEPVYESPCCDTPSGGSGYGAPGNTAPAAPSGGGGSSCGAGGKSCG